MKVVIFYADLRPRSEKIKSYAKVSLKLAVLMLIIAHNPGATAAFKANAVYELINAVPMPLIP